LHDRTCFQCHQPLEFCVSVGRPGLLRALVCLKVKVDPRPFAGHAQRTGGAIVRSFTDVASGRKDNRREYHAMLDFVRGHAKHLFVGEATWRMFTGRD
jgi:hypothetical protein